LGDKKKNSTCKYELPTPCSLIYWTGLAANVTCCSCASKADISAGKERQVPCSRFTILHVNDTLSISGQHNTYQTVKSDPAFRPDHGDHMSQIDIDFGPKPDDLFRKECSLQDAGFSWV
jgi:hypothetical protein